MGAESVKEAETRLKGGEFLRGDGVPVLEVEEDVECCTQCVLEIERANASPRNVWISDDTGEDAERTYNSASSPNSAVLKRL